MTNQELYRQVSGEDRITTEVTDILHELDETASVTTQAEVNKLLVTIYERAAQGGIVIEELDGKEPATQEQIAAWVEETFDPYSAKLFRESRESENGNI